MQIRFETFYDQYGRMVGWLYADIQAIPIGGKHARGPTGGRISLEIIIADVHGNNNNARAPGLA